MYPETHNTFLPLKSSRRQVVKSLFERLLMIHVVIDFGTMIADQLFFHSTVYSYFKFLKKVFLYTDMVPVLGLLEVISSWLPQI